MMVQNQELPSRDSLYGLITSSASQARPRTLLLLLVLAAVSPLLLVLTAVEYWPMALFFGSLGTIALWGLLAHAPARYSPTMVGGLQRGLVVLGHLLALAAAAALFVWLLGPRWNL
jgi:hypothetical protein